LYLVSDEAYITELPGKEISKRLLQRNIQTRVMNPAYISYKFDLPRESAFHSEIRRYGTSTLNSDMQPYAVYLDLLYLNEPLAPGFSTVYSWFRHLKESEFLLLILSIFILVFFYKRNKKSEKQMPVHLVLFSSGFAGMATSLIMILFFQALFGYVYLWIGMIISGFMMGIAAGSFIYTKDLLPGERPDLLLLLSETAHVIFFLLLAGGLGFLRAGPNNSWFHLSAPYFIIILSIISGLLTGFQFPLANRLYLAKHPSILYSAGTLYAADLAGAWLAGILVTLLMIPVLGLFNTAAILLCLKACTACLVWQGLTPGTSAIGNTASTPSPGRHRESAGLG
jgi:spermidine synthase